MNAIMENYIEHSGGKKIPYSLVMRAMEDQGLTHYSMSMTGDDEKYAIILAVNQGIDSHLEACNCPERGDSYVNGDRSIIATADAAHWKKGDKLILAHTLDCKVSKDSLPILLRRLGEIDHSRYGIIFEGETTTEEDDDGKELKFISEEDARRFINENIVANDDYLPEYRDGKKWSVRQLENNADNLVGDILQTLGINEYGEYPGKES